MVWSINTCTEQCTEDIYFLPHKWMHNGTKGSTQILQSSTLQCKHAQYT
jgi:hypothetical protein